MNDLSVHENSLQETADTDYKDAKRTSLFGARQVLKIRWSQGFVPRALGRNEALRRTQGRPVLSPPPPILASLPAADFSTAAILQRSGFQPVSAYPLVTWSFHNTLSNQNSRRIRFQTFSSDKKMELNMLANCYWFEFIWYISKKLGLVYRVSGNASS